MLGISLTHEVRRILSALRAGSHHALACILLRLDDIQNFVLMICNSFGIDDIHGFAVMNLSFYFASFSLLRSFPDNLLRPRGGEGASFAVASFSGPHRPASATF